MSNEITNIENLYDKISILLEATKKNLKKSVNTIMVSTYFEVGRLIVEEEQNGEERAKYGNGLIKEYSKRLTSELGKGYSIQNLKNMRRFYLVVEKRQSLIVQFKSLNISWTFIIKLLKLNDVNELLYYINCINKMNLTTRELDSKLKSKEYERLDNKIKEKLVKQEEVSVKDKIPDPIVLEGLESKERLTEKIVQKWIDENPASFCEALGEGYSYIKSQYKIKIGSNYNYIDILLFNYIYNCFVVIELKVTELKKEHMGQIETYMNYIDKNLKTINQDKTIGIIITKKDNKFIIEYCSDKKILNTTYELQKYD